ncbi:MAG: hypothetical protein ACRELF_15105, partial [Gemmataceae bacterium]
FEAGAVFKIVDDATPVLRQLTRRVLEFDDVVSRVTRNLAVLGAGQSDVFATMNRSILVTIANAKLLSDEWMEVAKSVMSAAHEIGTARIAGPATSVFRPGVPIPGHGRGRGAGVHSNIGLPLPIGDARIYGHSTAALIGGGALAYGVFEEAKFEDAAFRAMYTAQIPNDPAVRAKRMQQLRDLVQTTTTGTGRPIADVEEAVLTGIRQLAGQSWDKKMILLPELLAGAATESILKGTTVTQGMEVYTGLAHMSAQYTLPEIEKLIPAFAYLSTVDPLKITQIMRAASYAVPILHSGLDVDPLQTLLLVAALQRAGVTNTKSGTWLRSLGLMAMPGTSLMSQTAFKKHEEALKELGLVDAKGTPTWFTGGKPDLLKLLNISSTAAQGLPLTERAAVEKQLFGTRGFGAMAVLSNPAVLAQIEILRKQMPSFQAGLSFFEQYNQASPIQQFRTSFADLQKVLMDIGTTVLPPVVVLLNSFDAGLKALNAVLGTGVMATIISAGVGALAGAKFGPGGALIGGSIGAVVPNLFAPVTGPTKDNPGLLGILGLSGKFSLYNLWKDLTGPSGLGPASQSAASAVDSLWKSIES